MSRKQKFIVAILIITALAVILWLILASLGVGRKAVNLRQNNQETPKVAPGNLSQGENQASAVNNFQKANSSPATAEAIARSFAERFGSFSNQSDFENIKDLYPFMTAKMRVWAENYIVQARAAAQTDGVYYGITTRALGSKTVKDNKTSAVIQINTSRRETGGSLGEVKEYLQNIELTLIKESGDFWKVEKAEWQK